MPAAVTTYDWGGQFTAIQQGQGGQVMTWGEDFPGWDDPANSKVSGLMQPAPLPANAAQRPPAEAGFEEIPDLGHQGGSTYCLSKYSKNADAAWVFLQWATCSNTQTLASIIGGGASPMRQSTFDDPRVKADEVVGAGTTRHFPAMHEVITTRMGTEPHLPQWPLIATDIIAVELGKLTTGGYGSTKEAADAISKVSTRRPRGRPGTIQHWSEPAGAPPPGSAQRPPAASPAGGTIVARVTILGAGDMGTALATPLARNGHQVHLWGTELDEAVVAALRAGQPHPRLGVALPPNVHIFGEDEAAAALAGAALVVVAITSDAVRKVVGRLASHCRRTAAIVTVAKGFDGGAHGDQILLLPEALAEFVAAPIVAVGGPSKANEVAWELPTAVVFGGQDAAAVERCRAAFATPAYAIETTDDVIGLEIAAAMKNAYAIALGIADGLEQRTGRPHHNLRAALFPRAVAEMARAAALGGRPRRSLGWPAAAISSSRSPPAATVAWASVSAPVPRRRTRPIVPSPPPAPPSRGTPPPASAIASTGGQSTPASLAEGKSPAARRPVAGALLRR